MTLAEALNKHGLALLGEGQHDKAVQFFRECIQQSPDYADGYTNLGVVLFMQGDVDGSIQALQRSLRLRPHHADTLLNLGHATWRKGDKESAHAILSKAFLCDDKNIQVHVTLAALYRELGCDHLAIIHATRAVELEPTNRFALETLRETYHFAGDYANMLHYADRLIDLDPNDTHYPIRKSLLLMAHGDPNGWKLYEQRYATSENDLSESQRTDPIWFVKLFEKKWDGKPTGHLLIHREQGFGDVLQFLRFVPMAAERCEKVSLYLPPSIQDLARRSLSSYANVKVCARLPEAFDHYCLIMSLPYLLDALQTIPEPPHIIAPHDRYEDIRRLPGLKVGVAWSGSPKHMDNHHRSIPLDQFASLFDCDARFVSLQLENRAEMKSYGVQTPLPEPIEMLDGKVGNWTDTAGLIDALDLVIAVDTAVVHLAGGMGKPVWLLNRYNTDFRWMLNRSDTVWYPNMLIFRQPSMNDWDTVLREVTAHLKAKIRSHNA